MAEPWTITVCEDCGEPTRTTHRHKPVRNGIITYSGLREVEVAPKSMLAAAEQQLDRLLGAVADDQKLRGVGTKSSWLYEVAEEIRREQKDG